MEWARWAAGAAMLGAAAAWRLGRQEASRLVVEHLVVNPLAQGAPSLHRGAGEVTGAPVTLPRPATGGLRLAHVSDLHVHRRPATVHRRLLQALAQIGPDLLVLTGDYIDRASRLGAVAAYAQELAATVPRAVAVWGNHDHEGPAARLQALQALLEDGAGITVLRNRRLTVAGDGVALELVGVDSPDLGLDDLPAALAAPPVGRVTVGSGRGGPRIRVTAAHTYHVVERHGARCGALALVGDTHGGQLVLPLLGPVWATRVHRHRFVAGLYPVRGTWVYVNRGVGTIGPPVRWQCPPELAVIDVAV